MSLINFLFRKKTFFLALLLLIVVIFLIIHLNLSKNSERREETGNIKISNVPQDSLDLGAGYSLELNSLVIEQESQVYGTIVMDSPQDKLEVHFDNRGNTGNYILKVLYDYEEVDFKIDNKNYQSSYPFHLETGKSIRFPIELASNITADKHSRKLLVAVYASPEKNASTIEAMTNEYGMTLDYEITFNKSNQSFNSNKEYTSPEKKIKAEYQGLMVNENFNNFKEILYPPYNLKAKKGEKIKLAYNAGKYPEAKDYLIISMLDWKQTEMNGAPYLFIKNDPNSIDYGTFFIKAPEKEGLYEYSAVIVPDPYKHKNDEYYSSIETGYRFTIEVE